MSGGSALTPVKGIPRTSATAVAAAANKRSPQISASSSLNFPLSANSGASLGEKLKSKVDNRDGIEDKKASGSCSDSVFGSAPSPMEVEKAIIDLKRFMLALSAPEQEANRLQPRYDPKMLQSSGYRRVLDAFHMLQTDPWVQKMVVSISCDKAVWDAILNNEAVLEFRGALTAHDKEEEPQKSNEPPDFTDLILRLIFGITKAKIIRLLEKFRLLVNEIFQPEEKENSASELTDLLEERVKSSWLLSVLILLIIAVTRHHGI